MCAADLCAHQQVKAVSEYEGLYRVASPYSLGEEGVNSSQLNVSDADWTCREEGQGQGEVLREWMRPTHD